MKKKILATLLVLVLILSSVPAFSFAAIADGTDTENTVAATEVRTFAELKAALDDETKRQNIQIMADIDMGGTKIQQVATLYDNTKIYGNNHSLYNIMLTDKLPEDEAGTAKQLGIFWVNANAHFEIYDLNIGKEDSKIVLYNTVNHSWKNWGGVTANANGSFVMENVNIYVDTHDDAVGGTGCFAGFFGNLTLTADSSMNNCHVYGDVSNKYASGNYRAGGFIGQLGGPYTLTFNNCTNNATVSGGNDVGGFISDVETTDAVNVVLNNCVNNGTVRSMGTSTGGFIGRALSGSSVTMNNCINNGTLTVAKNNIGGLIGYSKITTTINRCVNYADISSTYHIGGLIGLVEGSGITTINDSVSFGTLSADDCVAGIIGKAGSTSMDFVIKDCINAANITADNITSTQLENTGSGSHFVMNLSSKSLAVTNCYSYGTVSAATEGTYNNVTQLNNETELLNALNTLTIGYFVTDNDGNYVMDTTRPQLIGAQKTAIDATTNEFNIRFIASLKQSDLTSYEEVGFKMSAVCYAADGTTVLSQIPEQELSSKFVFKSLLANTGSTMKTYTAADLGGKHIIACTFEGVPAAYVPENATEAENTKVTFTVTPYVKDASTTTFGTSYTFTYTGGVLTPDAIA